MIIYVRLLDANKFKERIVATLEHDEIPMVGDRITVSGVGRYVVENRDFCLDNIDGGRQADEASVILEVREAPPIGD
ncbi:hypothetical protein JMM59_06265 [Rhodovulum sulfidophilum]|uniref:hypothetical protein n=1 Tax=Rhodovulum sulfidophilum TaxID=35806 RepID=UPI0019238293|nr:hypothetical protein [Rhodovulum sulfidophilum]MBL3564611.1 hypothetical protein [Rhodovulum sulfidophilum]